MHNITLLLLLKLLRLRTLAGTRATKNENGVARLGLRDLILDLVLHQNIVDVHIAVLWLNFLVLAVIRLIIRLVLDNLGRVWVRGISSSGVLHGNHRVVVTFTKEKIRDLLRELHDRVYCEISVRAVEWLTSATLATDCASVPTHLLSSLDILDRIIEEHAVVAFSNVGDFHGLDKGHWGVLCDETNTARVNNSLKDALRYSELGEAALGMLLD
mmetsp:Transcript_978/g.2329  ORF Transcript_978/g.2329 Transcript_978/m.2329 type:complete len:214 (+) Transcript_978:1021-1662(+)